MSSTSLSVRVTGSEHDFAARRGPDRVLRLNTTCGPAGSRHELTTDARGRLHGRYDWRSRGRHAAVSLAPDGTWTGTCLTCRRPSITYKAGPVKLRFTFIRERITGGHVTITRPAYHVRLRFAPEGTWSLDLGVNSTRDGIRAELFCSSGRPTFRALLAP